MMRLVILYKYLNIIIQIYIFLLSTKLKIIRCSTRAAVKFTSKMNAGGFPRWGRYVWCFVRNSWYRKGLLGWVKYDWGFLGNRSYNWGLMGSNGSSWGLLGLVKDKRSLPRGGRDRESLLGGWRPQPLHRAPGPGLFFAPGDRGVGGRQVEVGRVGGLAEGV